MNIGTVIKKLRREREMTQEVLSESLGVSVSAVSQWESGKTAPDISLVPSLCNLFDVSADVLFEIDKAKNEEKIKKIRDEAGSFSSRGYNEEARKILEAGFAEFPESYAIMQDLMYLAYWQSQDSDDNEKKNAFKDEAISLGEKILGKCTEDDIRHGAVQILCYCYSDKGEIEKAKNLAKKMPTFCISHEALMSAVTRGTERYRAAQREMFVLFQLFEVGMENMNKKLDDGTFPYNAEECAALREKQIALFDLIFENGDFGFYHGHLYGTHSSQATYYAVRKNTEKALYHLERAAYHAVEFVKGTALSKDAKHTSLLFRGEPLFVKWSTGDKRNDASRVLDTMKRGEFDFIREEERFLETEKKLTAYAGDWKTE